MTSRRARTVRGVVADVAGPRLQHAHGDGRVLAEPGRDHVARGAAADHDVVEFVCPHGGIDLLE
ncbi:hypothetical protein [Streptomyces acidicola]|uniref:hypothetical protein n=1 Tax=Streptomyces acidicola TaxID=2596892 RepID=UPI003F4DEA6B